MKLQRAVSLALLLAGVLGLGVARPASAESDGVKLLGSLLPKIGEGDGGAQDAFQNACFQAARPGAEEERASLCRAIAAKLGPETPKPARIWLLRQLEHIGRAECVDALSRTLLAGGDGDALIRERARRALQNNPSPEAAACLVRALGRAADDKARIGLVNALGYRGKRHYGGEAESARALMAHARRGGDELRAAACEALAQTGQSSVAAVIAGGMRTGSERSKRIATDAYLILADRLAGSGDKLKAREIYQTLMAESGYLKCAAIVGIGRAGGDEGFDIVIRALADKDAEVRGAAVGALEVMPTEDLVRTAQEKLRNAEPEFKAGLLRVLAGRARRQGTAGMAPMFISAAKDPDRTVRLVAIEALGKVGDASAVRLLAGLAAGGAKEEQDVARRSLGLLAGEEVDFALVAALAGAANDVKVELIKAIAARRANVAVPELISIAKDPDGAVRAESFKALAELAGGDSLPTLVDLLVNPRGEDDRKEAEKAVLAACRRVEPPDAAASPIVDALRGARGVARLALLRVLGKIGGPDALLAVRDALRDRDTEVQDAAVRALCEWPTPEVASDLRTIVRTSRNQVHSVLAFRGYVRLAGLDSSEGAEGRARLYEEAMTLAPRKEDKKLVLAGLGDVAHIRALDMVTPYLDDATLRSEAATAVAKIARGIAGQHRDEAMDALKKVIAVAENKNVRQQAQEAINIIEKYEDYITAWQVSGPYTMKDKRGKGGNLLDTPFQPEIVEAPGAKKAKWKLWTGKGGKPWFVDFNALFRGDNRAAYLRAQVYSPEKREARLEIGSDDGVKVWINGEVVHNNNANRGCREGEDKKKVTLDSGWNKLVMKISNGGADWAACLRVRAADGSKFEGLRTKAE